MNSNVPAPCSDLSSVLGSRKMEAAAVVMWKTAHKYQDWKEIMQPSDFRLGTAEAPGLFLLIGYGWLEFDNTDECFRMTDGLIERIQKAASECLARAS